MSSRTVLTAADIDRALSRIAHEILESNQGAGDLVLLGIPTRGFHLATRLAQRISSFDADFDPASSGSLDITLYRDDLDIRPYHQNAQTVIPVAGINGKTIVLVDDVLYSGRTIRAALDALSDFGRPKAVRLATLIDRGHRELPIRADFVGKNLPTAHQERISVRLNEVDGVDEVVIES